MVKRVAAERASTVAISALGDDGVGALQAAVEAALQVRHFSTHMFILLMPEPRIKRID